MKLLCLATHNQGKARELSALLAPLGFAVKTLAELGVDRSPEETGQSFAENARIKAMAALDATGLPSLADDSGLCVDALNGEPGVYSARYGGFAGDKERSAYLLGRMEDKTERSAYFACAVVLCFPDGRDITTEGLCRGEIARKPVGDGGFGYDPVFYLPELGRTMAQLRPEEKAALSHRGRALEALAARL